MVRTKQDKQQFIAEKRRRHASSTNPPPNIDQVESVNLPANADDQPRVANSRLQTENSIMEQPNTSSSNNSNDGRHLVPPRLGIAIMGPSTSSLASRFIVREQTIDAEEKTTPQIGSSNSTIADKNSMVQRGVKRKSKDNASFTVPVVPLTTNSMSDQIAQAIPNNRMHTSPSGGEEPLVSDSIHDLIDYFEAADRNVLDETNGTDFDEYESDDEQHNETFDELDQFNDCSEIESISTSIRTSTSTKRMRKHRDTKQKEDYFLKAYQREATLYTLGPMNLKCKFCGAIFYAEEQTGIMRRSRTSDVDENGYTLISITACCDHVVLFASKSESETVSSVHSKNQQLICHGLIGMCQGQVFHKYNAVATPNKREDSSNGQLYFLDTQEAQELREDRLNLPPTSLQTLLQTFEIYIRDLNPFAKSYRLMKEVYEDCEAKSIAEGKAMPDVKMLFSVKPDCDKNKYNLPATNEVCAIIIPNEQGQIPMADIVVHARGDKRLQNLYPLNPKVEPFLYPLYYPTGQLGWDWRMQTDDGKKITLCDFDRYILYYRPDLFSPHHRSGKLFQQWCVDQCARIEWDRIQYIVRNQKEVCKTDRKNIEDFLKQKAQQMDAEIGSQIVLPSSFVGSPRYMHELFMDAMTIVAGTGKPDYFITYTCNPRDPDILKELPKGDTASNHPELVARVFKLKKDKLIKAISGGLFGELMAYCWVIEYQKRGLPHLHILFTVKPQYKHYNAELIDKVIQAQIPDKDEDPELYALVTNLMMHGPCNPGSPCWDPSIGEHGGCSKGFPKKFNEKTHMTEDGYPNYARPNNGRCVYRKKQPLTNQHVVPYNPYLLKLLGSHINVQICSDIKAIKYLYKYICKGLAKAILICEGKDPNGKKLKVNYNEAREYMDARYLCPVEAAMRILKFQTQAKSHKVEKLDVHLPDGQQYFLNPEASVEAIREALNRDSKLTAYFKFLQKHSDVKCLYADIPKMCTWNQSKRCWQLRKRGQQKTFGRIYPVNPIDTERYYLRYMLTRVCENSYDAYLTYKGIKYSTFAEAAKARGFTKNDEEYRDCLREASHFQMPKGLRTLFVNILVHCAPKTPGLLWNEFKDHLSEDIAREFKTLDKERIYARTLFLLEKQLQEQGKCLADFGPAMPQQFEPYLDKDDENVYDTDAEQQIAKELIDNMNDNQRSIVDQLQHAFVGNQAQCAYIDGPGGTGKSYTLTALYHLGIAATILKKGQTLHKRFKLPLDVSENSTSGILNKGKEFEEIRATDIFIWDEAPMASKHILNIIDRKLREIMKNDLPFGGKSLILAGDFRQTLTVKEYATRSEIIALLISRSNCWKHFHYMELFENMRADDNEKKFAKELLDIGNGSTIDDEHYVRVPEQCVLSELSNRAILSPYNNVVERYNNEILDKFPGELQEFFSIDDTDPGNAMCMVPEYLNSITLPNFPKHRLAVKKNCVLMLLRNLNVREGLCNGTRLRLLDARQYVLHCEILNGDKKGEHAFIPRITLIENRKIPYILERRQFPVRLAFAFTINKAQSQTFQQIGLDYRDAPFSHGQTYVALSRARSWKGIKVMLKKEDAEQCRVKNIVWCEALYKNQQQQQEN